MDRRDEAWAMYERGVCDFLEPFETIERRGIVVTRWYGFDPSVGMVRRLVRWARNRYADERGAGCRRVEAVRRVWRQRQWAIAEGG